MRSRNILEWNLCSSLHRVDCIVKYSLVFLRTKFPPSQKYTISYIKWTAIIHWTWLIFYTTVSQIKWMNVWSVLYFVSFTLVGVWLLSDYLILDNAGQSYSRFYDVYCCKLVHIDVVYFIPNHWKCVFVCCSVSLGLQTQSYYSLLIREIIRHMEDMFDSLIHSDRRYACVYWLKQLSISTDMILDRICGHTSGTKKVVACM